MSGGRPVAVVTGATGGIGRWIALGLARAGRHVVMVGRDPARGRAALDWVRREAPAGGAELVLTDLSGLAATRALAADLIQRHPAIELLVNNAGVFLTRRTETAEGHETVLAVNHLSPFVLARALEPALRQAAPARIVTVGSSSSDRATIDPADLELRRGWGMVRAYRRAKLAQMMTGFEQAYQLEGSGVTANVVHPGGVATGLVRAPGIVGLAWRVMAPFLLTEEQGADTPLFAALSAEAGAARAVYFKRRAPSPANPLARDRALAARVWAETERLVGHESATVGGIEYGRAGVGAARTGW